MRSNRSARQASTSSPVPSRSPAPMSRSRCRASEANLEFTRTYNSAYGANEKTNSKTLGQRWQPSAPVESEYEEEAWQKLLVRHEDAVPASFEQCMLERRRKTNNCESAEGQCEPCPMKRTSANEWESKNRNPRTELGRSARQRRRRHPLRKNRDLAPYTYIPPEEAKEFALTKSGANFILADSNGTTTEFTQNGTTNEYAPSMVSFAGDLKQARVVYDSLRRKEAAALDRSAPLRLGSSATPSKSEGHYAPKTEGCRSLDFTYTTLNGEKQGLEKITYYNSTRPLITAQVVARYGYLASGNLSEEWDPRIPGNPSSRAIRLRIKRRSAAHQTDSQRAKNPGTSPTTRPDRAAPTKPS